MSVTITAKLKRETDRARLIDYNGEDIWLPKSQVESVAIVGDGIYQFEISDWIARQKNITEGIADERFAVAEYAAADGSMKWKVEDMGVNPIHVICRCDNERDAMIISAALEMTKNKTL